MEDGLLDSIAKDIKQLIKGLEVEFNYYSGGGGTSTRDKKSVAMLSQGGIENLLNIITIFCDSQ